MYTLPSTGAQQDGMPAVETRCHSTVMLRILVHVRPDTASQRFFRFHFPQRAYLQAALLLVNYLVRRILNLARDLDLPYPENPEVTAKPGRYSNPVSASKVPGPL